MIRIAEDSGEWRDLVGQEDSYACGSFVHADGCTMTFEHAHHIVYKSQIPDDAGRYIVENGIALSDACHRFAHETHNESIGLTRANEAVKAVNVILSARGRTKIQPFRKKATK